MTYLFKYPTTLTIPVSAVVCHIIFAPPKQNQPTQQTAVRPSSPRKKGLAFYISCIMAWSIGPIEVGATHKDHGVVSPLKTDMSPSKWAISKGKDQGTFVSVRCFKRSPVDTEGNIKHQEIMQVRGKSRSYC